MSFGGPFPWLSNLCRQIANKQPVSGDLLRQIQQVHISKGSGRKHMNTFRKDKEG